MDRHFLDRIYKGNCSKEELASFHRWLLTAKEEEMNEAMKSAWECSDDKIPEQEVNFDILFQKILLNTAPNEAEEAIPVEKPTLLISKSAIAKNKRATWLQKISTMGGWRKMAAVFAGILFIAGFATKFFLDNQIIYHKTAYGETKEIILPDGSLAILNANSVLEYSSEWKNGSSDSNDRKVKLKGEAFFNVVKKELPEGVKAKFIVQAEGVNVEVVGTSFNVNNRRGITKVVLNSGKVRLNFKGKENTSGEMEPGELAQYSNTTHELIRKKVDPEIYTSWRHNKLIFHNTPLEEVFQLIEDNYGYKVTVKSKSIKKKLFTDSAQRDDLDTLLEKLSTIYNLNITKKQKEIIVSMK